MREEQPDRFVRTGLGLLRLGADDRRGDAAPDELVSPDFHKIQHQGAKPFLFEHRVCSRIARPADVVTVAGPKGRAKAPIRIMPDIGPLRPSDVIDDVEIGSFALCFRVSPLDQTLVDRGSDRLIQFGRDGLRIGLRSPAVGSVLVKMRVPVEIALRVHGGAGRDAEQQAREAERAERFHDFDFGSWSQSGCEIMH